MTIAATRSDKARKTEPASPRTDYDPALDAYASWLLAVEELHITMVAELVADHECRMPDG